MGLTCRERAGAGGTRAADELEPSGGVAGDAGAVEERGARVAAGPEEPERAGALVEFEDARRELVLASLDVSAEREREARAAPPELGVART